MLKKELAMHQRRSAEALAFQRQQTQRMAKGLSKETFKLSQSFSSDKEDDESRAASVEEMGKVLSVVSPPPPPPGAPNNTPPRPTSVQQQQPETKPEPMKLYLPSPPPPPPGGPSNQANSFPANSTTPFSIASPQGQFFLDEDDEEDDDDEKGETPKSKASAEREDQLRPLGSPSDDKHRRLSDPRTPDSRSSNEVDDNDEGEDEKSKIMTLFARSASPKKPMSFNEEFPSDIVQPLHRSTPGHRFGNKSPQEQISEQGEDTSFANAATTNSKNSASVSSSMSPTVTSVNSPDRRRNGPTSMSSIDAFEASFDTNFPDAFSPKEEEAPKNTPTSSEIYNPFFPSPARSPMPNGFTNSAGSPHMRPLSTEAPVANDFANSTGRPVRGHSESLSKETPLPAQPKTPDANMRRDPSRQVDEYSTPPKAKPDVQISPVDEPKRPEKTISAVARARYEKAMQPRKSASSRGPPVSLSVDTGATSPSETSSAASGSPSLLQRIHQRRMKKKMEKQQSASAAIEQYSQDSAAQQNDQLLHRQQSAPESMTRQSPDSFGSEGRHNRFSTQQQPRKSAPEALPPFQEAFAGVSLHARREMDARSSSIRSEKPFDEMGEDPFVDAPPKRGPEQRNSLPNGVRGGHGMLSPDSMNREMKSLDAMVGYGHHEQVQLAMRPTGLDGMKQPRRNVKQPVSYAEPALNTKLRQGDMFFHKAGNGGPSLVTPEPSAPQNPLVM
jgi:hypothetical protein